MGIKFIDAFFPSDTVEFVQVPSQENGMKAYNSWVEMSNSAFEQ